MVEEFNTLLEYSTCVRDAIKAVTHDDNMAENDRVDTIYATSQSAYSKIVERIVNGNKNGPLITFYISSIEVDKSVQLGGWKLMNLVREEKNYQMRAPVVSKLKYTITINCIKESQADLLQSQIMLAMPFNRPYCTKLNGQWVTMWTEDCRNISTVDVGNDKDKISRREITLLVDRAYLEHPYYEMDRINKDIEVYFVSEEEKRNTWK